MELLFVTATAPEAIGAGLLSEGNGISPGDLIRIEIAGQRADLLITGVGQAATSYALGRLLAGSTYQLIINLGIAGSFSNQFPPGEAVLVTQDEFADLGAESESGFLSVFDLGLAWNDEFPFKEGVIHDDLPAGMIKPAILEARGVTVNKVQGRVSTIDEFRKKYPYTQVESMEGAAFFYACRKAGQPCIQIRAVSNFVEPRNRENWKIKEALAALKKVVHLWLTVVKTV